MAIINPYAGVEFDNCLRVSSFTHAHAEHQTAMNKLVSFGYKFMPVSNYYPSKPTPREFYESVPDDVIIAPNAEHHHMHYGGELRSSLHICSLGSNYESGNPEGVSPIGVADKWQTAFKGIIKNLKYGDAGGITINHPNWTKSYWDGMNSDVCCKLLDFDPEKVLGIEIYNTSSERDYGNGYSLVMWDDILKTGRRCWGFVAPDWDVNAHSANGYGKSVLLLNTFTEYEAFKAYRNGNFYGQKKNTNLSFKNISFSNGVFKVETENAQKIAIIEDGIRTEYSNNEVSYTVKSDAVYVRAEAFSSDDEIYTNPIMINPIQYKRKVSDEFLFLY